MQRAGSEKRLRNVSINCIVLCKSEGISTVKRAGKERTKQNFKLRLLALILALALLWYSVNPAPHTIIRRKREDEQPDAKKREAKPEISIAPFSLQLHRPNTREAGVNLPSSDEELDDFDWPEFIDG